MSPVAHAPLSPDAPLLQLQGFGVAFGSANNQRVVLADLNLTLTSRLTALMGPVKTGKSTLFRTLAGLYEGHGLHRMWGQAQLMGRDIGPAWRPAAVQQHARLLDTPLWQVLRQPSQGLPGVGSRSPQEWRGWVVDALQRHGLPEAVPLMDVPLIDTTPMVQRATMALAQALSGPGLLLIDEPTYGLDTRQADTLIDWLKRLAQHCPLWVSLHNQKQARQLADAVVLMGGGRVLAHQPTEAFFNRPANEWVEQFVGSGSLSLPSPDAKTEDLEAGITPPPSLPDAAQAVTLAVVGAAAAVVTSTPTATVSSPMLSEPAVSAEPKPPVASAVSSAPERGDRPVALPMPLRQGVEMASSVGRVMLSDSRGPKGFRWVVPGVLAGCPQPGVVAPIDYDLMLLDRAGITHLITLTETDLDQDALKRHSLNNVHLPIFDRRAPSTSQMHMLLVRMQRLIDGGGVLAIHCKAGLGRTGLVLAAWLVRDGGLGAETAIERLRKINPGFIQSDEQLNFLHQYEADILRRLN